MASRKLCDFFLPEDKFKMTMIDVPFSNFSGIVWMEDISCFHRVKAQLLNFFGVADVHGIRGCGKVSLFDEYDK